MSGVFLFTEFSDSELQGHCSPPTADAVEAAQIQYLFSVGRLNERSVTTVAKELRRDVAAALARNPADLTQLALLLSQRGWQVCVRTGVTRREGKRDGSASPQLFKQLRHSFLLVDSGVPGATAPILVDPSFREQFALGASTPAYDALLAAIPRLYVGCANVLRELVPLMAARVAQALSSSGLPLPPWRDAEALLSLWLPMHFKDVFPAKDIGGSRAIRSSSNSSSIASGSSAQQCASAVVDGCGAGAGRAVQAAPALMRRSGSFRMQKVAKVVPKQIVLGFEIAPSGGSASSVTSSACSFSSSDVLQQQLPDNDCKPSSNASGAAPASCRHDSASSLAAGKPGYGVQLQAAKLPGTIAQVSQIPRVGSYQRGWEQLQQLQKLPASPHPVAAC